MFFFLFFLRNIYILPDLHYKNSVYLWSFIEDNNERSLKQTKEMID